MEENAYQLLVTVLQIIKIIAINMGTSESIVSLADFKSGLQALNNQNHPYLGQIQIWKTRTNNLYFSKKYSQFQSSGKKIPSSFVNAKNKSMYERRKALNHPNIGKLLYFDESQSNGREFDGFWEYPGETTLNQANFNESNLWKLIDQTISACSAFQLRGFYHGDIRPENIFLDNANKILLVESTLIPGLQSGYQKFINKSKFSFLSPQDLESAKQMIEKPNSDRYKSDVYSLGMTVLQLATKQNSFDCYDFEKFMINQQVLKERIQLVHSNHYSLCLFQPTIKMIDRLSWIQVQLIPQFNNFSKKMMENLHTPIQNEQPFYKDLIFCTCEDHSKHKKPDLNSNLITQGTQTEQAQPEQLPLPQPIPLASSRQIFALVVNPNNGQVLGEINVAEPITQQNLSRVYSPQAISANPSPSRVVATAPFLQQSPIRQVIQPQQLQFDDHQYNAQVQMQSQNSYEQYPIQVPLNTLQQSPGHQKQLQQRVLQNNFYQLPQAQGQIPLNFEQYQENIQNNISQRGLTQELQFGQGTLQQGGMVIQNNQPYIGQNILQPNVQGIEQNLLMQNIVSSPYRNQQHTQNLQFLQQQPYSSPQHGLGNQYHLPPLGQDYSNNRPQFVQPFSQNQDYQQNQQVSQELQTYSNLIDSTNYSMVKDYSNKELDKRVEKALIVSKSLLQKLDYQY